LTLLRGGYPLGDLADAESFFASVAQAKQADGSDEEQARFDEEFAAIEPIHAGIFQAGIGEKAVPEKGGGCEIDREVEGLPKMAPETDAQVGSDNDKCKQAESDRANGVFKRLGGRIHGINKIEDVEARVFVKEQNRRMKNGNGEGNVSGPVVKAEIVESMMRPRAMGAVAEGHEQAKERVERDGADGGEADVSGEI